MESGKSPTVLQVKVSVETEHAKSILRAVTKKNPFSGVLPLIRPYPIKCFYAKEPRSLSRYSNQATEWAAEESRFRSLDGKDIISLFQSVQTDS